MGLGEVGEVGGEARRHQDARLRGVAGGREGKKGVLEAARAVSNPEANFHGWGMTVNRSGDGEAVVWDLVQAFGGALTDATGQVVTLDTPQTVEGVRWLADVFRAPDNRETHPAGDQRLERHQQ